MPSIFILRASSGYCGGGLDFALRVPVCAGDVCENAVDMPKVFQTRIAIKRGNICLGKRSERFAKMTSIDLNVLIIEYAKASFCTSIILQKWVAIQSRKSARHCPFVIAVLC